MKSEDNLDDSIIEEQGQEGNENKKINEKDEDGSMLIYQSIIIEDPEVSKDEVSADDDSHQSTTLFEVPVVGKLLETGVDGSSISRYCNAQLYLSNLSIYGSYRLASLANHSSSYPERLRWAEPVSPASSTAFDVLQITL